MKIEKSGKIIDVKLDPGQAEERLDPCPFCGKKAELVHTWTACYTVKCQAPDCGAEVTGMHANELRGGNGRRLFRNYGKHTTDYQEGAHQAAAINAVYRWNRRPRISGPAVAMLVMERMKSGELSLLRVDIEGDTGQHQIDLEAATRGHLKVVFGAGVGRGKPGLSMSLEVRS